MGGDLLSVCVRVTVWLTCVSHVNQLFQEQLVWRTFGCRGTWRIRCPASGLSNRTSYDLHASSSSHVCFTCLFNNEETFYNLRSLLQRDHICLLEGRWAIRGTLNRTVCFFNSLKKSFNIKKWPKDFTLRVYFLKCLSFGDSYFHSSVMKWSTSLCE